MILIAIFIAVFLFVEINKLKKIVKNQDIEIKELQTHIPFVAKKARAVTKVKKDILEEPINGGKNIIIADILKSLDNNKTVVHPKEEIISEPVVNKTKIIEDELLVNDKPIKKTIFKSSLLSVESIISKLGILLLLISFGFIFKLSYDNGYITENLIILFGVVFGVALLGLGLKVRSKNRIILSQVLFGGGVATFFITTYSAYQVYGLISSIIAFAILVIIALISFSIAIAVESPAMSIIGVLGGLITPFVVDLDFIGLKGLGIYILILSICSMAIYLFKKWKSLLISSVVGVFGVTCYLSLLDSFSVSETYQLALLILAVLIIFNGADYILFYRNKISKTLPYLNPILLGLLPLLALVQIYEVLDISNKIWSLNLLLISFCYMALTVLFYKKREIKIITDITFSFIAFFAFISSLLYFEGSIRVLIIISMSFVFYLVSSKLKYKYVKYIGHIIYVLSLLMAFNKLFIDIAEGPFTLIQITSHLAAALLLTVGILLQKDILRYIFGIIVYEIFAVVLLTTAVYQIAKESEPIAIIILFYAVWMIVLHLLSKKFSIVPKESILVMGLLPIVLKGLFVVYSFIEWNFNGPETIALVIYSIVFYMLANILYKEKQAVYILLMKVCSYITLTMVLLIDIWILTDHFGYGLFAFGLLVMLLLRFEPNLKEIIISVSVKTMKILWLFALVVYILVPSNNGSLNLIAFVFDIGLLGILYLTIKSFEIKVSYQFIIHALIYMIIIHNNLNYSANVTSTVTLLWAAYALISLSYSVVKVKRKIVNLSILMIVIIAIKFVVVDISTVSIMWKIVTSMIFGVALLILSYVLQPILTKNEALLEQTKTIKKE